MKVAVIGTGFGKHAAAPAYRTMGFDVEVVSPRDGDAGSAAGRGVEALMSPSKRTANVKIADNSPTLA